MKKRVNLLSIYMALIISIICTSCASIVPMTDEILNKVGGEDNIKNFQYYVSKTITLDNVEKTSNADVKDGKAKIIEKIEKNKITISKSTPGVVIKYNYSESVDFNLKKNNWSKWFLRVAFEDSDDNLLSFGKYENKSNAPYKLLYTDGKNSITQYGDAKYKVSYQGEEVPYLLIKLNKKLIEKSNKRTAKGRTIK